MQSVKPIATWLVIGPGSVPGTIIIGTPVGLYSLLLVPTTEHPFASVNMTYSLGLYRFDNVICLSVILRDVW